MGLRNKRRQTMKLPIIDPLGILSAPVKNLTKYLFNEDVELYDPVQALWLETVGVPSGFSFPDEIYDLATSDKDVGARIEDVKNHDWTRYEAERICRRHYHLTGADVQNCIPDETYATAREIVLLLTTDGRSDAEQYYGKHFLFGV